MAARVVDEVRRQVARHAMLPAGALGLVAVSGGADSVALLLALHDLGCRLVVAHLDHGLRPESPEDAAFVGELATGLGLSCVVERRDVGAYKRKLSLEAAAREVRYAFLREAAEQTGAQAIFVAHTADDQVETFLLRLTRGAGPAGLGGMKAKDGLLCRPMLGLWRTDVEAFARERGAGWREDPSNRDRRFLRNRVRHELLPLLASMNPGIKQVLLREAEVLAERQREIEAEVLRRLGLSARQIAPALAGQPVVLKGGLRLEPPKPPRARPALDQRLPLPGSVAIPGVGTISAKGVVLQGLPAPSAGVEYVDLEQTGAELRVRNWRPGDRFMPLGMSGAKKLQDFFVDEHVARDVRERVPLVVTDGGAIVWVVGMRIDERFKVTRGTSTAVRLQLVPN